MKKMLFFLLVLCLATVVWAANGIVINEIMYNSSGTDVEFVELYNASESNIDLTDWYLLDDNDAHNRCLLNGPLQAGEYLVIAGNIAQVQAKYPGVSNINQNEFGSGDEAWSFGNGGDVVRLFTNTNSLHDIVAYDDGGDWPGSPDGNGPSLELLHPGLDNALPTSWDPSQEDGGTPGQINSVYTTNVEPTCKDGARLVDLPTSSSAVTVTVLAYDNEGLAQVELMVNTGSGYTPLLMNDNGQSGDSVAGDSLFSAIIPAQANGTLVKYYALATDDIGQQDLWPNNAPEEYHAYTTGYTPPDIRVTELLAVNSNVNTDEAGEYDDWFEIHNADDIAVNIGGMFVSSSLTSSQMFQLPAKTLAPGEFFIIWADNDTEQGSFHTDFRLSSMGEAIGIFETIDHGNVLIHGWKYGRIGTNVSVGLKPIDASAPEFLKTPTPGASNQSSDYFSPVCINEFQSTSDFGGPDDWIEMYNRGNAPFDLSGCYLSDQRSNNTKWTFPQGKILQPGEFLVIYEDVLNFGWSSDGDDVIMFSASDSTTGLDFYDFGAQIADHSEGRYPDGLGYWTKFDTPTKGSANIHSGVGHKPSEAQPETIRLFQNFPNPFNPVTSISFALPVRQEITLKIFNATGREIMTLANNVFDSGHHTLLWHAQNMSSGTYYYELSGDNFQKTGKMILLR